MPVKTNFNMAKMIADFGKVRKSLPRRVGGEAVRFFKNSFRWQGFREQLALDRWPGRSPRAKRDRGRALLVDSGRLRRSIRVTYSNEWMAKVGTDVPYARIHNEGGTISGSQSVKSHNRRNRKGAGSHGVKAHNRVVRIKMPKRKFMGDSKFFNDYMIKEVEAELRRILVR